MDYRSDMFINALSRLRNTTVLVALIGMTSSAARSAIINAADGTRTGIQNAVDAAAPGDIVAIPAGTWEFPGTVNLKEGIHVRGAGRDVTTLKRMDAANGSMFSLIAATGAAFKISGITFEGIGLEALIVNPASTLIDRGITVYGKSCGFEIFGCRFRKFSGHGVNLVSSGGGTTLPGQPTGVVRDNEFIDIFYTGTISGNEVSLGYGVSVYGDSRWPGLQIGSGKAVFIENNTFLHVRHCVASNNGSRYVFRYNTASQGYDSAADAHGKTSSDPGSRAYEIYNNTISGGIRWPDNANASMPPAGIRGGDGVIFNNTYSNPAAKKAYLEIENFVPGGGQTYSIPCQTTDLWVWGNTLNGSAGNTLEIGPWRAPGALTPFLQVGRDYHYAQKSGYTPYRYPHPVRSFAGWWALDGIANAIAVDSSASGNNGTLNGSPTLTAGALGNAVGFNGTGDHMQVPYSASLNSGAFTFSAWVYVTGNEGSYRAVISSRDSGYKGYILYAGPNNTWQFWTGSGISFPSLQGPAVALNTWTHLAGTYDGATKRLYVNGSQYSSASQTTYLPNTLRPLRFGAGNNEGSATYFFKGKLDDARVYSRALAPAEIYDLYNGLSGRWRLDDITGAVALDSSDLANDGTLIGSPTLSAGAVGNAVGFNGTGDHMQVPYSASLNSGAFTFSAWVYVTGNEGSYRAVISSRDSGYKGFILYAGPNNTWQFWTGSGTSFLSLQGPVAALNTWTHIAGSYDGTTKRLYVNGSQYSSTSQTTYLPNILRPLRLAAGNNEGSATYFFKGKLEDARVYSRALAPSEISQIYTGSL